MKLSKKALDDFLKQYKPNIECKDGFVPMKAYHNWLVEQVECPRKQADGVFYEHKNCSVCHDKPTISRVELYLE